MLTGVLNILVNSGSIENIPYPKKRKKPSFLILLGYLKQVSLLMMKISENRSLSTYSDKELVEMMKNSSHALTFIYEKHRDYCLKFMNSMFDDRDEIKDIYQDAVIVFYEKAITSEFNLTCSIQTYLNSICRNQVLVRLTKLKKNASASMIGNEGFLENLTDWFDDSHLVTNDRVAILKGILTEMKESAGKCYEILVRFFYLNQTMEKIAQALEYTNADNAKNQKYRCQEKLKSEMFKRLPK
jgi:RNA polymerase sigma factor (sigma-70 family)